MSMPRIRCGSRGWREPTARWTSCVAVSSSAIWKPVLPPPTTRTRPSGTLAGFRYSALWSCGTVTANSGTRGTWNGPVATITWSACSVRSASSTSKPGCTPITRLS